MQFTHFLLAALLVSLVGLAAACDDGNTDIVGTATATEDAAKPETPSAADTEVPAATEAEATAALTEEPTSAPEGFRFGDTILFEDGSRVTVYGFEAPAQGGSEFISPDSGNVFFAIDTESCAGAEGGLSSNPFWWEAQMPDNTRRNIEFGGKQPELGSTELSANNCVRGWVTFEVPDGVPPIAIHYSDFKRQAEWSVQ